MEDGNREPICRVAVVNRNTRDLLLRCLASLEHGRLELDLEVVVTDCASTDGSTGAVRERFPGVRVIDLLENRGYSYAINRAAEGSRAAYLLVMNSDVELDPGSVRTLISFLEYDHDRALAAPMLRNPDGSMQRSWNRTFPGVGEALGFVSGLASLKEKLYGMRRVRRVLARLFWFERQPISVSWVGGACFMVRRDVFEELGGMDEDFFLYSEDTDLCRRVTGSGKSVWFVPSAGAVHHWNASIGQLRDAGFLASVRSGILYHEKHSRGRGGLVRALFAAGLVLRLAAASLSKVFGSARDEDLPKTLRSWEALEIVTGSPVREHTKRALKTLLGPFVRAALAVMIPRRCAIDASCGIPGVRRILVMRYDGIGDLVLTLPLIRMIGRTYTGARITVLASERNHRLLEACPFVHEVRVLPPVGTMRKLRVLRDLRRSGFDLVVDPVVTDSPGSAALARLTRGRFRCGFAGRGRERFFNVAGPAGNLDCDLLVNNERLARCLGYRERHGRVRGLEDTLVIPERSARRIGSGRSGPVVGIHPGGRYPTQRWPLERYLSTARELLARGVGTVIFFDRNPVKPAPGPGGSVSEGLVFIDDLDLMGFVKRLGDVDLLLCNNSGPLHIARALGIPTVSLAGPTREAFVPRGDAHHAVLERELGCRPCDKALCWHHSCFSDIGVDEVVGSVTGMLERDGILDGRMARLGENRMEAE